MAQLKLWRVVDPPTSVHYSERSSAASPVNAVVMDMANPQEKAKKFVWGGTGFSGPEAATAATWNNVTIAPGEERCVVTRP